MGSKYKVRKALRALGVEEESVVKWTAPKGKRGLKGTRAILKALGGVDGVRELQKATLTSTVLQELN